MHANNSVLKASASPDAAAVRSFYAKAWSDLAAIRNAILIFVRDRRSQTDLVEPMRILLALKSDAETIGLTKIVNLFSDCEHFLSEIRNNQTASLEPGANNALDVITEIEASLLEASFIDDEPFPNISDFVDESFENLLRVNLHDSRYTETEPQTEFEIDEETLEIFRDEASELLDTIAANIETLISQPDDRDALWNIRRCAHTFKGAAGIVGLKEASELAHRVEDLLDQLAEDKREISASLVDLLADSSDCLSAMTVGTAKANQSEKLSDIYKKFDRVFSEDLIAPSASPIASVNSTGANEKPSPSASSELVKPLPAQIVRVALGRMDELLKISRNLDKNWASLAGQFAEISRAVNDKEQNGDNLEKIVSLFETQGRLTSELHDRLLQIRLVRFGMLSTRLNRAVHVTCQEENKKAAVVIENDDVEIDTQILDSLVEPLLHLLRNAVVHGIESPETRRLIGKHETGQIKIDVKNSGDEIVVTIQDDGRGISAAKLREKAVSSGAMNRQAVEALSDEETFALMFLRGVTTAETLSMNAGRGVGMSIVKESIESGGGRISIKSELQKGTTFTIRMPHALAIVSMDQTWNDNDSKPRKTAQNLDLTVLIVDDSSAMRQMISRMIEKTGCKIITAADGLDAIETLRASKAIPDIILTDLEMPRMNGYEFIEILKNDERLRVIPVVMITSRTGEEHRQKAFDLGIADFMTKPFNEDSLIKTVTGIFSEKSCR
ncbi:MAG: response regulator [Pyrinomonadaceae bacterium]